MSGPSSLAKIDHNESTQRLIYFGQSNPSYSILHKNSHVVHIVVLDSFVSLIVVLNFMRSAVSKFLWTASHPSCYFKLAYQVP